MENSWLTKILCRLFLSIAFLKLTVGLDTLLPDQELSPGQTLVSQSQLFELGFFSRGTSRNSFLGIWYKTTPDIVVWVANRIYPITDPQGATFSVSRNGTLVLIQGGSIIWSENPYGVASNPVLHLLDTGNLVLANGTTATATAAVEGSHLWQSFDHPADTWLPGMKLVDDIDAGIESYITSWTSSDDPSPGEFVFKIENQGLPELVIKKGKRKTLGNGKWNGVYFNGYPRFPSSIFKPQWIFRGERLVAVLKPYDPSIITRGTLDPSGSLSCYILNQEKNRWIRVYSFPADKCDEYGLCGGNGVCRVDKPIRCECLKGFVPKFQKDWDFQDWSGGCTRIAPLNCHGGDGFLEVRGVKHPDLLEFRINGSLSLRECHDECLRNCNCSAYANPYITNGGSGCVMWFGDLMDTRELSDADSKQNMYIRLPVSQLVDYSEAELEETKKKPTMLILISIASGVIVSGLINGGIFMMTRRKRREADQRSNEDVELPLFKFSTIVASTNNFSNENIIGQGGFGPVYKGQLSLEGEIAIKRMSRTSGQGVEEFKNEVILIAKLQHTNLVRLLGCCIEGEERILVYEYMHNKSLDHFVFDKSQRTLLTWPKRFDIIMGIARGLLYLHHDSRLKIIHRDLKTSNILLDGNLNPKISDFGIARTFGEDQPIARTTRVVGTYGYMSPEYAMAGKFSVKSDVFSLGVVLLEIVSGKKNRGFEYRGDHYHTLLGHAWLLWKENRTTELMDECLKNTYVESEVKRCIHVGLLCAQKLAEDRPAMSSVLFMLGSDGAVLPDPKEPGFYIGENCNPERNCSTPSSSSEGNTLTMTDLEAR